MSSGGVRGDSSTDRLSSKSAPGLRGVAASKSVLHLLRHLVRYGVLAVHCPSFSLCTLLLSDSASMFDEPMTFTTVAV